MYLTIMSFRWVNFLDPKCLIKKLKKQHQTILLLKSLRLSQNKYSRMIQCPQISLSSKKQFFTYQRSKRKPAKSNLRIFKIQMKKDMGKLLLPTGVIKMII
jgi:hypothetical protein